MSGNFLHQDIKIKKKVAVESHLLLIEEMCDSSTVVTLFLLQMSYNPVRVFWSFNLVKKHANDDNKNFE